jgi:hypothetical protein
MVNSNSFKDNIEYKTYYKQSLNDDLPPYQGMIPHYKFINGIQVGEIMQNEPYISLKQLPRDDENHSFLIIFFILWLVIFINVYKLFLN